jgi:hypothetical protein
MNNKYRIKNNNKIIQFSNGSTISCVYFGVKKKILLEFCLKSNNSNKLASVPNTR